MGDLVLSESEVGEVMKRLQAGGIEARAAEVDAAGTIAAVVFEHDVDRRRIGIDEHDAAEYAMQITVIDQAQFVGLVFAVAAIGHIIEGEVHIAQHQRAEREQRVVVDVALVAARSIHPAQRPMPVGIAQKIQIDAGNAKLGPACVAPGPCKKVDLESRTRDRQRLRIGACRIAAGDAEMHTSQIEQGPGALPMRVDAIDRHRAMQLVCQRRGDFFRMRDDPRQYELGHADRKSEHDHADREQP